MREGEGRIDSVDGLRALAFSAVFAYHTWEFAGRPDLGVLSDAISQNIRPDFFVVLTGFVLTLPFARDPRRLAGFAPGPYLRRRLRRIVLPYYAALAFAVLLPQVLVVGVRLAGWDADWQPLPSVTDWLWHLSFLQVFSVDHWAGINGSLWTMSLEMQLYLLFPVLLFGARRWGVRGLGVAFGASLGYRCVAGLAIGDAGFPVTFLVGANGLGRLPEFLAGMACAVWVFRRKSAPSGRDWLLVTGAGLVGALAAVSPTAMAPWSAAREIGLGVLFAAVIAVGVLSRASTVFGHRTLAWVGYRSYSLFLVHQPLMWFLAEFLTKVAGVPAGPVKLAALWTVGLALTVVVGEVFFLLVERPCIAWAKATPVVPVGSLTSREVSR